MKTEQEIRQMVNTCNQYHSCAACPYNPEDISRFIGDRWKGGCPDYDRQLVYAMGKGYGDVSEYKAEIKRLKAENERFENNMKNVLKIEKRQAQIDVLKELKTRHDYAIKNMGYPWDISQQIDELIEEVEEQ